MAIRFRRRAGYVERWRPLPGQRLLVEQPARLIERLHRQVAAAPTARPVPPPRQASTLARATARVIQTPGVRQTVSYHPLTRVYQRVTIQQASGDRRPRIASMVIRHLAVVRVAPPSPTPQVVMRREAVAMPTPPTQQTPPTLMAKPPSEPPGRATATPPPPVIAEPQLSRLADAVLHRIERRAIAQRERLGRS